MKDGNSGSVVAVDWGTSSLRLWLLARDGTVLAETRSKDGMAEVPSGGFEAVLRTRLAELGPVPADGPGPVPVVLCGMVGARQGWREAGYVDVPTPLSGICERAMVVPADGLDARILPGLAQRSAAGPDVMRGEETQLLGLALSEPGISGTVCMPGTHSKWVTLDDGGVSAFETVLTGELFAVLSGHSILRHTIAGAAPRGDPASTAFRSGLADGLADPGRLAARLFSIRAAGLLLGLDGAAAADRLSGLLIGAEVGSALARAASGPIRLVADGRFGALYGEAFAVAGRTVLPVDADRAVRGGLLHAAGHLWPALLETTSS